MKHTLFQKRVFFITLIVILSAAATSAEAQDLFNAKIYLQGTDKGVLLFNYTNEIRQEGDLQILAHNYNTPDGGLFAREQLILNNGEMIDHRTDFYPLKEFSRLQRVDDGIKISFRREEKSRSKIIPYRNDIVFGPTQQQYIRENLTKFQAGEVLTFHLPAPEFTTTTSFTMKKIEGSKYNRPGVTVLQMGTRNIILKLLVGKNQFVVDEKTGTILEIHGPSVLKRFVDNKWKFVDADIYFDYPD